MARCAARASTSRARNLPLASLLAPSFANGKTSDLNHGSRWRRTAGQAKAWRLAATRCVGRIVQPSLRVLKKVIIAHSYGAPGLLTLARARHSLREFSAVSYRW